MKDLGNRIRILRKKKHLTQQQLGLLMGFNESSAGVRIAQYENNKKIPRDHMLKQFATVLEIDEHALLSNHEDEMINQFIDLYWLGMTGKDLIFIYKLLDVFKEYSHIRYDIFQDIIKGIN